MSNNLKVVLLQRKILKKKEPIEKINYIKLSTIASSNKDILNEVDKLKNPKTGQVYVHIINNDYSFYQFNGKEWDEIV